MDFFLNYVTIISMINAFLLIGQSNMAGRGDLMKTSPINNYNILVFRNETWVTAEDPLHHDAPETGVGPGMSFAEMMLQLSNYKKIGLIPCAVGGTSIDEWYIGSSLYSNAVETALSATKQEAVIKGILWHQGESDAIDQREAENHIEKFEKVMAELRKDLLAEDIPLIIGELGYFLENNDFFKYYSIINTNYRLYCMRNKGASLVSASGLKDKGDFLHFDSRSQRELGTRYALRYEEVARSLNITFE